CPKRIDSPAAVRGHYIVVAIEVQHRPAAAERADDVDPRMLRRMLMHPLGRQLLEAVAEGAQLVAHQVGGDGIAIAWWIDRGHSHQSPRQLHELRAEPVDLAQNLLFGWRHAAPAAGTPCSMVALRTARTIARATTLVAACPSASGSALAAPCAGSDSAN